MKRLKQLLFACYSLALLLPSANVLARENDENNMEDSTMNQQSDEESPKKRHAYGENRQNRENRNKNDNETNEYNRGE